MGKTDLPQHLLAIPPFATAWLGLDPKAQHLSGNGSASTVIWHLMGQVSCTKHVISEEADQHDRFLGFPGPRGSDVVFVEGLTGNLLWNARLRSTDTARRLNICAMPH
jgi:hypothetical protein